MADKSSAELARILISRVASHDYTQKAAIAAMTVALAASLLQRRKSVEGKTIVLTGAATGLGRAQAFALAKAGAKLVIWDINMEQLEKTAQDVRKEVPGADVAAYAINLASKDEVYALAERVKSEHGFIWGLINNAGIISGQTLMETSDKRIELTMAVNIMCHFWTVKAFLPEMLERNSGHIVAISSAAGFFPSARMIDYCTSKFAARGFMEALRTELSSLGRTGVKTTLVAPAHIQTDLFKGYNMMGTMKPEWVAGKILDAIETNLAVALLPRVPLTMGTMWQGILPTFVWDIFMLPTNSSLNDWKPEHANKTFEKMEK